MKLFCFPYNSLVFYQRPETVLEKPMEDFFIPHFCTQLSFTPIIAVKINKLGRSVLKKFAHRYYSHFSFGTALFAQNLLDEARREGLPWDMAVAMDSSLPICKEFIDKTLYEDFQKFRCKVTHPNGESELLEFDIPTTDTIDQSIEQLSRWVYIKMGDMACLELCQPIMLQQGDSLQAAIISTNGTPLPNAINFVVR